MVHHIVSTAAKRGGILVFLPGVHEILQCIEAIRPVLNGKAEVYPLHANLSSDEQRRVFLKTSNWKIIAATNIAEACRSNRKKSYRLLTCDSPDFRHH